MSALPSPEHGRNMRLIGHSDQGGRPDGVQLMVHRGFALSAIWCRRAFPWSMFAIRPGPPPSTILPRRPGTWNVHLQAHDDLLLVINARDLFADARFADEKVYYTRSVGDTVSDGCRTGAGAPGCASLIFPLPRSRGKSVSCRLTASVFTASGTSAGAGRACVRADRRFLPTHIFLTIDLADPRKPRSSRALVAAGDAPGGR